MEVVDESAGAQQGRRSWMQWLTSIAIQIALVQVISSIFSGNKQREQRMPSTMKGGGGMMTSTHFLNYFPPNTHFDLRVYMVEKDVDVAVSQELMVENFLDSLDNSEQTINSPSQLLWLIENVDYHKSFRWQWRRPKEELEANQLNVTIPVTDALVDGTKSLVLILVATPHFDYSGISDDRNQEFDNKSNSSKLAKKKKRGVGSRGLVVGFGALVERMPLFDAEIGSHNLLGNEEFIGGSEDKEDTVDSKKKKQPIPHLKQKIQIRMVFDSAQHTTQTLSQGPFKRVKTFSDRGLYHPVLFVNDFWLVERDFMPLNKSSIGQSANVSLDWDLSLTWVWALEQQMNDAWSMQSNLGLDNKRESFMIKRIMLETNPFLLAFSAVFALLHSLFSLLAFKNDIQFWQANESMRGLSALSIFVSLVCEIIIGLYLLDSRDTSWLILFELLMGIAVEGWKLTKAVHVSVDKDYPFVHFADKSLYVASKTKEYDEMAIKYMSVALSPCLIGYGIYSLYHYKYKSWYSYVISVLAGSVYMFGFIMMTPQLYINYRLKSVEHLPWKAMVYKALNTFVDDIAAFIIDMPWLHRLSCFRNDIIFFIYLYQRWIYRVDRSRATPWEKPEDAAAANAVCDVATKKKDDDADQQGGDTCQDKKNIVEGTSQETSARFRKRTMPSDNNGSQ